MLLSMTGYGTGEAPLGEGRLVVEARAVNHRFLDVRVRLPSELAEHAPRAEELARKRLDRGRIEIGVRCEGDAAGTPRLDRARARNAFRELSELRDELRPEEPVPLSLLSCVPDLFSSPGGPPAPEVQRALDTAVTQACDALEAMRVREGEALARDLGARLAALTAHVEEIRARTPAVVEQYRKKLHERIERLLRETDVDLDAGRLEHEVALFADRAEISEELTRLASHADQLSELLASDERTVGRKLDFILQEMHRETNTIGSKSSDAAIARVVVELKAELGRMREQAQNVL